MTANKAMIKGQNVGNLKKLIGSKVRVEPVDPDSQVSANGFYIYEHSLTNGLQETVEPIIVGRRMFFRLESCCSVLKYDHSVWGCSKCLCTGNMVEAYIYYLLELKFK